MSPTPSRALGWSLLNTAVSRIGTLGIGIVLARLLGPEEFGTYAVAFVALLAVLAFNELGVSLAVVRWPGDPKLIAPTVTTISLVSSLVLTVAVWAVAPAFTAAMGAPDATPVIRLLAISVMISGAVATPAALLQRYFRQDLKMIADQASTWVGAASSIGLALAGTGAMSLAVGRVAGAAVGAVLYIRFCPDPFRVGLNREQLMPLLRFGLPLAGASIVVFLVGYVDQLTVGRVLGATALGFYVLAFNLSSWPVTMFSQPLRGVAPPTFARLQHDPPSMRSALVSLTGVLLAVTLPVCLVLSGAASSVIRFVYGAEWAAAAPVLVWLGVLAAFKIFFELVYDYLVVAGASGGIFLLQLVSLAALLPAVIAGAHLGGIEGVAAAQAGVAVVVLLPLYLLQLRRVGVPNGRLLRRAVVPLAAATAVGLAAAGLSATLASAFLAMLLSGLMGVGVIVGLLWLDRAEIRTLRATGHAPAAPVEVPA